MGRRPFVRFYHLDWSADAAVDDMTMEEIGTYWTLLVRQMVDGFITLDRMKLRKRLNVETVEEVERLLTPAVLSKFVPYENDPAKLYNKRLAEVIKETDAASWKGKTNATLRWDPALKTPSLESSIEETKPAFNFAPILKEYPERNDKAGWAEGVRLMEESITDEETYKKLWIAVKSYRKEKGRGVKDRQFIMRLDNFMRDWTSYIPASYRPAPELKIVEDSPKPVDNLSKRSDREKAPWVPDRYDSVEMKTMLEEAWPQERRDAWEAGKENP